MGGGHEAFKLGVPVDAFLACFKPWVLDCSTARDEREWDTSAKAVKPAKAKAPKAKPAKAAAASFEDFGDAIMAFRKFVRELYALKVAFLLLRVCLVFLLGLAAQVSRSPGLLGVS